ncbi:MAG: toxin-antitoxin system HicB family antitoxin [Actinobacteria bacterium]|nr:toxin-antitoxin system HicB family antitoxin [Actinomycetota bacterium]
MRQLITRVDDDLHARLKAKAKGEGRSLNALVNEVLQKAAAEELTPEEKLRRRAEELGIELIPWGVPVDDEDEFIESSRGMGTASQEILAEREARR